ANESVRVAEARLVSAHLSVRNSCVQTLWPSPYFEVARSYERSCGNLHLQLYTIWIDPLMLCLGLGRQISVKCFLSVMIFNGALRQRRIDRNTSALHPAPAWRHTIKGPLFVLERRGCTEQGINSLNVAAATESTFCLPCAYGRCSSRGCRLCSIKVLLSSKTLLDLIICREVRGIVKACKGEGMEQLRLVGPFKCRRAVSNLDCATVFFGANLTDSHKKGVVFNQLHKNCKYGRRSTMAWRFLKCRLKLSLQAKANTIGPSTLPVMDSLVE
uniref:Uncharacterized protein n=1 Tax=Echinococcus canadensis TaxID=519352 RepID=A0A915EVE1_9CEST